MRTRTLLSTTVAIVVATCFASSAASAYSFSGGGGRIGCTAPEDLNSTVQVGGHLEFEQTGSRLHLQPNVMYWKSEGLSDVNPNFDVYYHFGPQNRVTPYLGGGLGVNMRHDEFVDRSDSELDANMIGGVRFPGRSNNYFLESRVTAGNTPQVALLGGITFASH